MRHYFQMFTVLFSVCVLLCGCADKHIEHPSAQTEHTAVDTSELSGNYCVEDFLWITAGEHNYWDIREAMPITSDEPVVKASKNSFS